MDLKQLLHADFNNSRNESASRDPIVRLLLPSVLTIILSVAFFMAASWAWFVGNQSCQVSAIQSGSFGLDSSGVQVTEGESNTVNLVSSSTGTGTWSFTAEQNKVYTVTMTVKGNVPGHFKVEGSGISEATYTLTPDDQPVKFQVCTNATGEVKISVGWGAPADATAWNSSNTPTFGTGNATNSASLLSVSEGENNGAGEETTGEEKNTNNSGGT